MRAERGPGLERTQQRCEKRSAAAGIAHEETSQAVIKRLTVLLSLCISSLAAQSPVAPVPPLAAPRAGFAYPQKQTLSYAVDWRVFPAGTAVLHLESDGTRQHIAATATTVGALNLLFHVNDRFQSVFDRGTGCSYEFDKQTVEGRRQINSTMRIDPAALKSILDEKNMVNGQTKHVETPIPGCMTDLLSGLFYAQSQPLVDGQSFVMPVVDAMHIVPVTMKVEGREEVKTPLGTYKTVRVQPTAEAGVVKNRGNIWIWYTDDEHHLPVQMRARLFWGTITFRLTANDAK